MSINMGTDNQTITYLMNETCASAQHVIPLAFDQQDASLLETPLQLEFGVLVGITGDVTGKMVLTSNAAVFDSVGEAMFGMPISDEMLHSFSGELGNMIAGRLSTHVLDQGITIDITSPTVMEGKTKLTGFAQALHVPVSIADAGEMNFYLLLD